MEEKIYEILVKVQKDVEQINFKGIDYRVTLLEA